jgi:hypothetical protein
VAFGGIFTLAGSVPVDHTTEFEGVCAHPTSDTPVLAAARAPMVFKADLRLSSNFKAGIS